MYHLRSFHLVLLTLIESYAMFWVYYAIPKLADIMLMFQQPISFIQLIRPYTQSSISFSLALFVFDCTVCGDESIDKCGAYFRRTRRDETKARRKKRIVVYITKINYDLFLFVCVCVWWVWVSRHKSTGGDIKKTEPMNGNRRGKKIKRDRERIVV